MKKIYMGFLLSLLIALMAVGVEGLSGCEWISPTATTATTKATYLNGTQNMSMNITRPLSENITFAVLTVSAGTLRGAVNFSNASVAETNISEKVNFSLDTTGLSDDTTVTFTLTVYNDTGTNVGSCTRSYITDNTVPVLTSPSPVDLTKNTSTSATQNFYYSCANTSSANLFVENKHYTMTESSDVCSATVNYLTNGFQSWYIVASDGLNFTTSATTQVEIRKPGGLILDTQGNIISGTPGAPATAPTNTAGRLLEPLRRLFMAIFQPILNMFNRG